MCFVCSEFEGFDTDISKIIGLTRNSNLLITRKEITPISNPKIYLAMPSEQNQALDESNSIYSYEFNNYKSENDAKGNYQIQSDLYDITEKQFLTFSEETGSSPTRKISAMNDKNDTFDQVTGLNIDSEKIVRIYKSALKRLPETDDLMLLVDKYNSSENVERAVASSFSGSSEFDKKYESDISDEKYVSNLYQNILGRAPDNSGMNYWLGQLNSGIETRNEVFIGFAESAENKALFTEMNGLG